MLHNTVEPFNDKGLIDSLSLFRNHPLLVSTANVHLISDKNIHIITKMFDI